MTTIKLIRDIVLQEIKKHRNNKADSLSIEQYRAPIMGTQIKRR